MPRYFVPAAASWRLFPYVHPTAADISIVTIMRGFCAATMGVEALVLSEGPMTFTRGDRKPCTYSGCDGTMRFSKYARRGELEVGVLGDSSNALIRETPGWVCDADARHFEGTSVAAVWHV